MLQFNEKPNYTYFAESINSNNKILGNLSMKIPSENYPHYTVSLFLPLEKLTDDEKQILASDMIIFIEKAQEFYNKADS